MILSCHIPNDLRKIKIKLQNKVKAVKEEYI